MRSPILFPLRKIRRAGAERGNLAAPIGRAGSAVRLFCLHDLKVLGATDYSRFLSAAPSGLEPNMAAYVNRPAGGFWRERSQTLRPCRSDCRSSLT